MSDLISRQAAIRELNGACSNWKDDTRVQEIVMALPSARPIGEWIPCEERLPQLNTTVIICCKDETRHLDYLHKFKDSKIDFCYNATYGDSNVIAWMPLPEPYKGGDDE